MNQPKPEAARALHPVTSGVRRTLRAIFVDDDAGEFAAVRKALQNSGFEPVMVRVETAAALRAELARGRWDMVFSDCLLPGFDGTGVLAIMREGGHDIPLIVISGNIGEDQAAAIMKAGAHDFIRKDQLSRLPGAVTRELTEARTRRAHRKVLAELAETSARLGTLVEAAPIAVIELDRAGLVQRWNTAAWRIFGWKSAEVLGSPLPVIPVDLQPDFNAICAEVLAGRSYTGVEVRWDRKGGDGVELSLSLAPLGEAPGGLLLMASGKCDMMRLQHRLDRAQHHEAIGHLISGLAQEIAAPLGVITHELDFLVQAMEELAAVVAARRGGATKTPPGGIAAGPDLNERIDLDFLLLEIPRALNKARNAAERADHFVHAMHEVSHPDADGQRTLDLNRAVECTATIARSEFRHVADLVLDLQPDLAPVECNQAEIHFVLLNLLVNAAHAVADSASSKGRGIITVSTLDDGDTIEVRVNDTGIGIPAAVRGRIFEPFFTTKPVGRGTGQGLATSRAIVQRHRGTLGFDSTDGSGTTFTLQLPKRRQGGLR